MAKLKVAVLISGRGTNMGALARATMDPDFPAEIVLVISNRPNVAGIDLAMEHDLPYAVIDHKDFDSREDHEAAMSAAMEQAGTELVCLAGYMRILTESFIKSWRGKILNIHPSLLPAFRGVDTHERALERGVRVHGCTVHFVNAELDDGPIVLQAAVPVLPDDTAETLSQRVLEMEHDIYPRALALIANKKIRWSGDSSVQDVDVVIDDVLIGLQIPDAEPEQDA
ncbi:phosphoribosylglycinamide formyltransferase [Pseudahrensia aquimaris]|uniref:Phosphoribosylglycinamide formyltransferase n=1 Tax=Pseudahrensia aquimaris TaxID=744461 RepID=A0ABW3FH04_9HYPH